MQRWVLDNHFALGYVGRLETQFQGEKRIVRFSILKGDIPHAIFRQQWTLDHNSDYITILNTLK